MLRGLLLCSLILSLAQPAYAGTGKLIGTAGLTQVEGTGGGGLVPWATLSGYDSNDEISVSANVSRVNLKDYRLRTASINTSIYDRVELSFAKHIFELTTLGGDIKQDIIGVEYRIYGDALYSKWPQFSAGILHKSLKDTAIAKALGASDTRGTDIYIAATKIHLAAIAGYNAVWNLSLRATKANELGLLGFGSNEHNNYAYMLEASLGMLLSRKLVIGAEYRQKPNNLGLGESDWYDFFISYIPTKSFNITLAWANLDTIAGAPRQRGVFVALSGQLH